MIAAVAALTISATAFAQQGGTAEEAKAMLEKAVAAVKADKTKALNMFNKGEGGFLDQDLYVFCGNATNGTIVANGNPHAKEFLGTTLGIGRTPTARRTVRKSSLQRRSRKVKLLKSAATCFLDQTTQSRFPRTASSREWAICTAASAITSRPRQRTAPLAALDARS
jgi:hypothetical protein